MESKITDSSQRFRLSHTSESSLPEYQKKPYRQGNQLTSVSMLLDDSSWVSAVSSVWSISSGWKKADSSQVTHTRPRLSPFTSNHLKLYRDSINVNNDKINGKVNNFPSSADSSFGITVGNNQFCHKNFLLVLIMEIPMHLSEKPSFCGLYAIFFPPQNRPFSPNFAYRTLM